MLLSAVSVLVVAQPSSEFPEGLMNYPVYIYIYILNRKSEPSTLLIITGYYGLYSKDS